MFRITQSFLVNSFAEYLREKEWRILYEDYVNGRRSGRGAQGAINYCFEAIFDQFPDIVAAKETRMLVVEVDIIYKHKYVEKLKSFGSKEHELLKCANKSLNLELTTVDIGMVFQSKPTASQAKELRGLHVWLYNKASNRFIPYRAMFSTLYGRQ